MTTTDQAISAQLARWREVSQRADKLTEDGSHARGYIFANLPLLLDALGTALGALEQARIALETDQQLREWVLRPSPRPFNSEEYWEGFPDVGQKGADERRKQALDAIEAYAAIAATLNGDANDHE